MSIFKSLFCLSYLQDDCQYYFQKEDYFQLSNGRTMVTHADYISHMYTIVCSEHPKLKMLHTTKQCMPRGKKMIQKVIIKGCNENALQRGWIRNKLTFVLAQRFVSSKTVKLVS